MIEAVHRAKYILTDRGGLIRDGSVHVDVSGHIQSVEPWCDSQPSIGSKVFDWGGALIIPGLVNAHAHLELTRMGGQLTGLSSFTEWLSKIVKERKAWGHGEYIDSIRTGALMALSSGTTLVGDISASGYSREVLAAERLRAVVFEETLGVAPAVAGQALAALESRIDKFESSGFLLPGASPHAPYSVSPDLYRGVADLARSRTLPLATHVAETMNEVEFLKSGTGEFSDFLSRLGVLPIDWTPPRADPIDYLDSLNFLDVSPLLIHCNYVDADAIMRILKRGCSVVYCPRSHAFFGHHKHPVRQMLDAGVNVAIGTDSLASNHSLSMLDEIRFLFKARKDLTTHEIFKMATINGAAALLPGGSVGRLTQGSWADMAVLSLPDNADEKCLLSQVLEGMGDCVATIVSGEFAWKRNIEDPGNSRVVS